MRPEGNEKWLQIASTDVPHTHTHTQTKSIYIKYVVDDDMSISTFMGIKSVTACNTQWSYR